MRVEVGRWRLRADHLSLSRAPGRVRVEGPVEVTLCDGTPPLSLRTHRAAVSEDGEDLTLSGAALRVGDTTILPVPWLWLRGPRRLSLHPPFVGVRGGGFGPAAGLGAHVPVGPVALDVVPVVSTRGAFDLGVAATSRRAVVLVGWERVGGADRVAAAGRAGDEVPGGAWSARVDAVRGSRAKVGVADLEVAARPFDRAGVGTSARVGPAALELGVESVAPRGLGAVSAGPSFAVGGASSLGGGALGSARLRVRTLSTADRSRTDGVARVGLAVARFLGVWRAEARAEGWSELDTDRATALSTVGVGVATLGLPLTRPRPALLVDLDPRVELGAGARVEGGQEEHALARLGVGARGARSSVRLEVAAGWSTEAGRVVRVTASSSGRLVALRAQGSRDDEGGGRLFAAGELLPGSPLGLLGRVAASEARGAVTPLWLGGEPGTVFARGLGWEAGVVSRLGPLRAVVRGAWDATHGQRLGAWGDLFVAPWCDCVAVGATVGHRADRGLDALVRLVVAPGRG